MTRAARWIVPLALAGCLAACQGGSGETATTRGTTDANRPSTVAGLIPRSRPPIPDVPVPLGFELAEKISRNYESAGARFVDHTYEGRADKYEVERFYANQMPLKGWMMRGRQMVRGTFLMRFEKGSEFCEVRITSDSSFTGERTSINASIQTLGRGDNPAYRNRDDPEPRRPRENR